MRENGWSLRLLGKRQKTNGLERGMASRDKGSELFE